MNKLLLVGLLCIFTLIHLPAQEKPPRESVPQSTSRTKVGYAQLKNFEVKMTLHYESHREDVASFYLKSAQTYLPALEEYMMMEFPTREVHIHLKENAGSAYMNWQNIYLVRHHLDYLLPAVLFHEFGHYYFSSTTQDWFVEGVNSFLPVAIMHEKILTPQQAEFENVKSCWRLGETGTSNDQPVINDFRDNDWRLFYKKTFKTQYLIYYELGKEAYRRFLQDMAFQRNDPIEEILTTLKRYKDINWTEYLSGWVFPGVYTRFNYEDFKDKDGNGEQDFIDYYKAHPTKPLSFLGYEYVPKWTGNSSYITEPEEIREVNLSGSILAFEFEETLNQEYPEPVFELKDLLTDKIGVKLDAEISDGHLKATTSYQPRFRNRFFDLILNIPLALETELDQIDSNINLARMPEWSFGSDQTEGTARWLDFYSDIVGKIESFSFSNDELHLSLTLAPVKNLSFGLGGFLQEYNNSLEERTLGALCSWNLKNFTIQGFVDDIVTPDLAGINGEYKFSFLYGSLPFSLSASFITGLNPGKNLTSTAYPSAEEIGNPFYMTYSGNLESVTEQPDYQSATYVNFSGNLVYFRNNGSGDFAPLTQGLWGNEYLSLTTGYKGAYSFYIFGLETRYLWGMQRPDLYDPLYPILAPYYAYTTAKYCLSPDNYFESGKLGSMEMMFGLRLGEIASLSASLSIGVSTETNLSYNSSGQMTNNGMNGGLTAKIDLQKWLSFLNLKGELSYWELPYLTKLDNTQTTAFEHFSFFRTNWLYEINEHIEIHYKAFSSVVKQNENGLFLFKEGGLEPELQTIQSFGITVRY